MALINELQKIGLSDKEARVYLAALELGQSSVQNIAKKSAVNRATTYVILESLVKKGLASTFEQDKKTLYVANDPQFLVGLFEIQKNEIDERKKYFENLLPELESVSNKQADKPVIRFFEGKQGVINAMEEFLAGYTNKDTPLKMFYSADKLGKWFEDEERKKFKEFRLKKKIKSQAIYNSSTGDIPSSPDGTRYRVPEGLFPFSCDIAIYGDSVRITSLGKRLSTVIIKDKEVAETLDSIFRLALESAEAKNKK